VRLHDGGDVALLVTGGMLETAVRVTEILTSRGINVQLTSMPWLAPFDDAAVALAAEQTGLVVTLEEHSVIGGLGGAVAEVVSGLSKVAPLLRIGLPRSFSAPVGGQSYLRRYHGLDEISVAERIENHLSAESKRCRQACASEG
jgi:transketolase